jgi:hypothetical protein
MGVSFVNTQMKKRFETPSTDRCAIMTIKKVYVNMTLKTSALLIFNVWKSEKAFPDIQVGYLSCYCEHGVPKRYSNQQTLLKKRIRWIEDIIRDC